MKKQFYSEDYVNDIETTSLLNELYEHLKDDSGMIFYKFPTVKEFDQPAAAPDIFIVSESVGVLAIVVDTLNVSRDSDLEQFLGKMEYIDNYIYTSLLKQRELKANARTLKVNVQTIGYCPNLSSPVNENTYITSGTIVKKSKILEKVKVK